MLCFSCAIKLYTLRRSIPELLAGWNAAHSYLSAGTFCVLCCERYCRCMKRRRKASGQETMNKCMQGILQSIPTVMHKPRLVRMCANDKQLFNISTCAPLPAFVASHWPIFRLRAMYRNLWWGLNKNPTRLLPDQCRASVEQALHARKKDSRHENDRRILQASIHFHTFPL